jgi:hypothetical protein
MHSSVGDERLRGSDRAGTSKKLMGNIVGAQEAKVELTGHSHEIDPSISDSGGLRSRVGEQTKWTRIDQYERKPESRGRTALH